ncbi:heat shock 70 kDa protein 12A-like isoform X1 [Mytilus californianus]|uniref:heat shock 70 kDa protein 12A-like isoform X1 n=1 Tax=Mytilus californianus TaxID=6549 RepID=UPI0022454250|nr:heat shock 70 kDa protein 12A-like isoform X1 [Mytilus californianus]
MGNTSSRKKKHKKKKTERINNGDESDKNDQTEEDMMPHNVHNQFGDGKAGIQTDNVKPQDFTVEVCVERQPKEDSDSMPSIKTVKDEKDEKTTIKSKKHLKLMVAAIDFGTTFSGFAHCMRADMTKIYCHDWKSTYGITNKAPTSVLFKPDMTFDSFGYEAEKKYYEPEEYGDLSKWYFFKNFKMILYEYKKQLNVETEIDDMVPGPQKTKMKAIDVFSAIIKYFTKLLLEKSQKSYIDLTENDILWVITVPGIWDLKAKQFMRESAIQAGIPSDQLILALEPEAASLYCRKMPIFVEEKQDGDKTISQLPIGSKYIVLDQGGGTIDITVHEVMAEGNLKEIHQACGGVWGSNTINKEFKNFLYQVFGDDVMSTFRTNNPDDYFEIMNEFELKKISYTGERESERMKISYSLIECYNELKGVEINKSLGETKFEGKVRFGKDKAFLQKEFFQSFFDKSVAAIVDYLGNLLRKKSINTEDNPIKTILAVGGFSKSQVLIDEIKSTFPDLAIVVPADADLAVLKGAIIYAFEPESVTCRVSQYTYGVPNFTPYDARIHKDRRISRIGPQRKPMIDDAFDKHIEIGQILEIGQFQQEHEYYPTTEEHKSIVLDFYASEEKNPKFTDEETCYCLGILHFDITRRARIFVKLNASGTELIAVARVEGENQEIQGYYSLI